MDLSPIIAAGGSVGLFAVIVGLLFRLLVLQNRREDQTADDIQALKLENAWCNRRVSVLIYACQQGGIAIPPEVWDGPPQVVTDSGGRSPFVRRGPTRGGPVGDHLDEQSDEQGA